MTDEPSAYSQVNIALRHGTLGGARLAALNVPRGLDADQALGMLLLIADEEPDRYGRAAARWLARLVHEVDRIELEDLAELVQVLGALAAGATAPARATLAGVLEELDLPRLARRATELPVGRRT